MIDEKEVLKILKRYEGRMNPTAYFGLEADIVNAPTVDAQPVIHAEWKQINKNEVNVIPQWKCSECGAEFECFDMDFEYCPNCGAKMYKEAKDGSNNN